MSELPDQLNFGVPLGEPENKSNNQQYNLPPNYNQQDQINDEHKAQTEKDNNFDLKRAGHPVVCVATFAFKALAIFFYLVLGMFISNIITFIFVILICSLDFWVVKNISGRLLVGLRWWSEIDSNGKEQWRFQNRNEGRVLNSVDKAFFWFSQIIGTAVWGLLFILKVLTLSIFWGLLLFICSSLCATNLYAYYQCRGDHKKKLGDLKKKGMMKFIGSAFGQ